MRSKALLLALLLSGAAYSQLPSYNPNPQELATSYAAADRWVRDAQERMFMLTLTPNWIEGGKQFWYRSDVKGVRTFYLVEATTGAKKQAFDHAKLASALGSQTGKTYKETSLPFTSIEFTPQGMGFEAEGSAWLVNLTNYTLTKSEPRRRQGPPPRAPWRQDLHAPDTREIASPDGKWVAQIVGHNVTLAPVGGAKKEVTTSGAEKSYFARLSWSPDSKRVVATRVMPGDRALVHLIESSPRGGGKAVLHSRAYDQPGDKVDTYDHWVIDVEQMNSRQVAADLIDYGSPPFVRWRGPGRYVYEKVDRGYGRWRLIEVDAATGKSRTLIDDDPSTFFDTTAQYTYYARTSPEVVWRSERSGWGHLYLTNLDTGSQTQITKGEWVVRGVDHIDESKRQVWFRASGREKRRDPYFIDYYRVNFDGTGLTLLTDGDGNHEASFSPDRQVLLDTWSRVDLPPVHELRRTSDGSLIQRIDEANVSDLMASGWTPPEVFVSKARDGKTDIFGIVMKPKNFDPTRSYPIVEDIYAGPHDSFVPKTFRGYLSLQALAQLGFIVVKVDGMGTRNRSKAFHDVAYRNVGDAGLPDRILWMKALHAKVPQADIGRVGIYGTSAGGQSSTGALLFHPEFYKVAVSACGCHDNGMDKIWWNEQWMGPMGPHYAEQSNITNASKLQGKLLLIVGELDDNVPPESTYRLVDALIKAGKDFDLLVIPGAGHTSGGSYGERRRRDFFVRHLHGVEPPDRNK